MILSKCTILKWILKDNLFNSAQSRLLKYIEYPDNSKVNEEEGKPGPGQYNVSGKPGKNYPIQHGTLYDITIGVKFKQNFDSSQKNPGPGQYRVKGIFDPF